MDHEDDVQRAVADVLRGIERPLQFLSRPKVPLPDLFVAPLVLHVDRDVAATGPMAAKVGAVVPRAPQAGRENDHRARSSGIDRIVDAGRYAAVSLDIEPGVVDRRHGVRGPPLASLLEVVAPKLFRRYVSPLAAVASAIISGTLSNGQTSRKICAARSSSCSDFGIQNAERHRKSGWSRPPSSVPAGCSVGKGRQSRTIGKLSARCRGKRGTVSWAAENQHAKENPSLAIEGRWATRLRSPPPAGINRFDLSRRPPGRARQFDGR